jgi:hypothetical protein
MNGYILKKLISSLSYNPGIRVKPKGDHRVEIPSKVVRFMGWDKKRALNIYDVDGGLVIAPWHSGLRAGAVTVSMKRVRIPYTVLKESNMDKVPLLLVLERDRVIVRKEESIFVEACDYLSKKLDDGIEDLSEITSTLYIKDDKTIGVRQLVSDKIVRSTSDVKTPDTPSIPLFVPGSISGAMTFMVIGKPYKFSAHLIDKAGTNKDGRGIVRCAVAKCALCARASSDCLYLVPVLNRGVKLWSAGYLLAHSGIICGLSKYISDRYGNDLSKSPSMILWHDKFSSEWKIFPNAPSVNYKVDNMVKEAQRQCADPMDFMRRTFCVPPFSLLYNDFSPCEVLKLKAVITESFFKGWLRPRNLNDNTIYGEQTERRIPQTQTILSSS